MITVTTVYRVHTIEFNGVAVAHTSHLEIAAAIELAATGAVDVAQARSLALSTVLEGVQAQGMPRAEVYLNNADSVTLSFTGAGELIEVRLPSSEVPKEISEELALVALDGDTRVFTATTGGLCSDQRPLPTGVDLNNATAVVDGVLPVLRQHGAVLEIEGENKLVFLPEGSDKARSTRIVDGHLWIECHSDYWEHASLTNA